MRRLLAGSLTPSFVLRPSLPHSHGRQRTPPGSFMKIAQVQANQAVHAHCRPGAGLRDCRPRDRMCSKAGDNLQRRGRPGGCPQQLRLGDADERREVHVLMRELNELDTPFLALKSVSENV
jgi:hypothetical protein